MSIIKNPKLAAQGQAKIEYTKTKMAPLLEIQKRFAKEKPLKGLRIGMALHVTQETAVLVETLKTGGAKVAIASCNPLSTQDDIAAALAAQGTKVFAYKGETLAHYYKFINAVIETSPHITIDDGCDLVTEIHLKHKNLIPNIIGGCEETTTGVIRLRAMERQKKLKYPIIAVNDSDIKHLFDNYYGTGQSTVDGLLRSTNVLIAGKTAVVFGYGDCGKGIALRMKGMGAKVIVCEVSPFRALQASMDGFFVMQSAKAAALGDIFITATGNKKVLTSAHFKRMKSGAILANSGHFNVEIDIEVLEKLKASKKRVREFLDEYKMRDGRLLYLAAQARLVNLAAAEGHPSEVMALSFSCQALACEYLVKNKGRLKPGVYKLPKEIDEFIAKATLKSTGIKIDKLTQEQKKYLTSFTAGT